MKEQKLTIRVNKPVNEGFVFALNPKKRQSGLILLSLRKQRSGR